MLALESRHAKHEIFGILSLIEKSMTYCGEIVRKAFEGIAAFYGYVPVV